MTTWPFRSGLPAVLNQLLCSLFSRWSQLICGSAFTGILVISQPDWRGLQRWVVQKSTHLGFHLLSTHILYSRGVWLHGGSYTVFFLKSPQSQYTSTLCGLTSASEFHYTVLSYLCFSTSLHCVDLPLLQHITHLILSTPLRFVHLPLPQHITTQCRLTSAAAHNSPQSQYTSTHCSLTSSSTHLYALLTYLYLRLHHNVMTYLFHSTWLTSASAHHYTVLTFLCLSTSQQFIDLALSQHISTPRVRAQPQAVNPSAPTP